ncbi:HipA domain-containing protein [Aliarcobacter butzleri]|uniref:HipA domain-containing protein n=1 Tax=Aliarcobacter butzleri TaxID=28197 RepID=UPI0021B2129B|nr:HipA domain-containing protein [Aliarcobacter butzleri]MCT7591097.1 HipA domain-containing protein [Aliarcobacter butzleri]
MTQLNIFYGKDEVAVLRYEPTDDSFSFEYNDNWKINGFELSPYMKFDSVISSNVIKNFIENLLPEGKGREILTNIYHISKNNLFALIQLIGKDTTGALTFNLEYNTFITSFKEISNIELSNRIKDRKNIPIAIWDGNVRLSIAGVQDKLPITILDGKYGFAEGELASTHILKFESNNDNLVLNEYLSLKLASIAGLKIPNIQIVNFDSEVVLQVERFDREFISNNKILRKHIIDGCQALNLNVMHKYERAFGKELKDYKEGVSFKKIFTLIEKCSSPIIAKKNIITWIIVNLCLGNSDAHGKNISFFIDKNRMELTPFYDILNIEIYENKYDTDFAMSIDGAYNINELGSYQIIEFCKDLKINLKGFVKEFKRVSMAINKALDDDILTHVINSKNKDFYEKYKKNVQDRIEKLTDKFEYCLEYEI